MASQQKISETLLDELGLTNLPQDKKDQLLIKMTEAILKRIFVETLEKLNEKDRETYEKMLDDGKEPEVVEAFLREKISNYDQMLDKVIADFKEMMSKKIID